MQIDLRRPILTGEEYVRAMSVRAADRNARAAFRDAVLRLAPPRGRIFDFGAGPGADAKFYAERGFRVFAHDIDEAMCVTFRAHCAEEIAKQRVTLIEASYEQLLNGAPLRDVQDIDLVTANFAPMNLVPTPRATFQMFHSLVTPRGLLLLSVLNPSFVGDMRYGWFWENKLRLWRDGNFATHGAMDVWRRSVGDFARLSASCFRLRAVLPGRPMPSRWKAAPLRWLVRPASQYLFLLFERT
jgi:SAM-dependent methyltransferase